MSTILTELLEVYIDQKRRAGMRSEYPYPELKRLVKYALSKGENFLTYKTCIEWLGIRSNVLADYALQERYRYIRNFSFWAHKIDQRHQVLPKRKRKFKGRRIPLIVNESQMGAIMTEIRKCDPEKKLNGYTCEIIAGLLFVTGMRIGEVLSLSDECVNLQDNYIYVKEGKTNSDRMVPIDESTAKKLAYYREHRLRVFPEIRERFFLFNHGVSKSRETFSRIFRKATAELGYRSKDQVGHNSKSLVPHDFRHSFAVNALMSFYKKGRSMKEEIPKLTIVLGHKSVRETYWYIEAIPELMELALRRTVQ